MHKIRLLKNAKIQHVPLIENEHHSFSSTYSLSIYPIDAVYTFIPKNACSSLRYSVALANGFINELSQIEWIHANNRTFISTQREVVKAKYTFVVLRCPFRRVASAFLDLVVDNEMHFKDLNDQRLSINFHEFLLIINEQNRTNRDQHWRNQSDFLHYERYDDYFSLELFQEAIDSLKLKGFNVKDTRKALNHDLSNLKRIDGDYSKIKEKELQKMKEDGYAPKYESMYGQSEIALVQKIYQDDIELYKSHFGDKHLLFQA